MYLLVDSYSTVRSPNEGRVGKLCETGNEVVSGALLFKSVCCVCLLVYLFEARLYSVAEAGFELLQSCDPPTSSPCIYSAMLTLFVF